MISTVDVSTAEMEIKLKFSTRAMASLEEAHDDLPIGKILEKLATGVTVKFLAQLFAAVINDGKGGTEAEAMDAMDALGGPFNAVVPLTEAANAAFPQIEPTDEAGEQGDKAKPAGKRKPAQAK